ncbi:MAG: hypothetical protein ABJE10_06825, partial [bacterium]
TANLITTGGGLPWYNEAMRQWLVWAAVIATIALVVARFAHARVEAMLDRGARVLLAPNTRVFTLIAFFATLIVSLYYGWKLFGWQMVVGDEFSQRFQAAVLGSGRLYARSQPHAEFFSTAETLDAGGRWFAQFPMGWAAMLALPTRVGTPWLLNPMLAGLAAVAVYQFVRAICDEITARTTTILFVLSPFVIFMAGSQMNHTATLACVWLALAALPRWIAADDARSARLPAILIGLGVGLAASIRPFDAAVVALMIGVFQLRHALQRRWLVRSIMLQCGVALIPVVLVLAANRATTGAFLPFAYDVLNGPEHRPGFHLTPPGFVHTPRRGLYVISAYLMKLDVGLLAWPVPAVLVVAATFALQRRANAWDKLLLAILGGVLLGYMTYWSESYFVGPRFLNAVAPIFLLYTARLPSVLRERTSSPMLRATAGLLLPLWIIVAVATPAKQGRLYGVQELARLYDMRGAAGPPIVAAVNRAGLTNAVVFVPDGWHARLAARLRALGMRPLIAEQIVSQEDACSVQQFLDAADQLPPNVSREERASVVAQGLDRTPPARKLANQQGSDQLAVTPGRAFSVECSQEFQLASSLGVSVAEMLPFSTIGANGELTGVVYARDFGARNVLLQDQFGDRQWYVARVSGAPRALEVKLVRIR